MSLIDSFLEQRENLYQEYAVDQLTENDWHLIHLRMAEQILRNQQSQNAKVKSPWRTWLPRLAFLAFVLYSAYATYELYIKSPVERLTLEQKNQLAFVNSPQGLWGIGITFWNPQGLRCLEEQKEFIKKAAITVEVPEGKGKKKMQLESGMCLLWVVPPENRKLVAATTKPQPAEPTP